MSHSFLSIKRSTQPFSIPTAITCKNNEQEQHSPCGAAWPTGGKDPFPWVTRCAVSVALCSWLLHQQLTMPGTWVQLLVGQCVLALWCASSKPSNRNNLLEQEFLTCPLLAEEINHKDTHWVQRSFRLLHAFSLTASFGKRAVAAEEKGLHILPCSLLRFFPPLRPYPSYYRSKLAGKKCWQLGVLSPWGCFVSQCK